MKHVFKMLEAALGRTPTVAEVQAAEAAEQDAGTTVTTPPADNPPSPPTVVPPTVTGASLDTGLSAEERAELETLRGERASAAQRQREALLSQANERGATQARDLLKDGKILSHQELAFAAAFGKLAELQAQHGESFNFAFNVVAEDGATTAEASADLFGFFASALNGKESNGLDKEKVKDTKGLGAVFSRVESEKPPVGDGTDNTPAPQSRIDNVVALAQGKRVDINDYINANGAAPNN